MPSDKGRSDAIAKPAAFPWSLLSSPYDKDIRSVALPALLGGMLEPFINAFNAGRLTHSLAGLCAPKGGLGVVTQGSFAAKAPRRLCPLSPLQWSTNYAKLHVTAMHRTSGSHTYLRRMLSPTLTTPCPRRSPSRAPVTHTPTLPTTTPQPWLGSWARSSSAPCPWPPPPCPHARCSSPSCSSSRCPRWRRQRPRRTATRWDWGPGVCAGWRLAGGCTVAGMGWAAWPGFIVLDTLLTSHERPALLH